MATDDPYHDRKIYHRAAGFNERGGVSALCFSRPREINLRVASWTIRDDAVTCPKCRKILEAMEGE